MGRRGPPQWPPRAGLSLGHLALFLLVYALIYFCWLRASFKIIKKGPEAYLPKPAGAGASDEEAIE